MAEFSPHWNLTPLMQRQIKGIEQTAGFLKALRVQTQWLGQLRSDARLRDALSSIQIEGGKVTLERAFELAQDLSTQQIKLRNLRDDEREFVNYLLAFDLIDGLRGAREYQVAPHDLRNLHRTIVQGVRGGDRFAGQFRRETVAVGDREGDATIIHHQPPHWSEVENEVENLMRWINAAGVKPLREAVKAGAHDPWVHPVIIAGVAQHRLVWIHPFVDGNGRSARMFTALILLYRGYDFKYLFDLSSYYNDNRDAYYQALRDTDVAGDYTPWLEFFLGGFAYQMVTVQNRALEIADGIEFGERKE